jgi:hypothetical protein
MTDTNDQHGNNTNANAGRGAGDVPGDLQSPYAGVDPELVDALAEAFPAPKPDMTATRILRGAGTGTGKVAIPIEMMKVLGWQPGDRVVLSAWIDDDGTLRVVKKQDM